jgi:8-oxo-dGTP pyrophosphatase MutT (NUDIX family)
MEGQTDLFFKRVQGALNRERVVIKPAGLQPAAVLVPIVVRSAGPGLLFTKRTMTVATHKGQISFPGGTGEPEDKSSIETALREAEEEIGLQPGCVQVIGLLDDFATTTGFLITPVVGIVDATAELRCDPKEVDELFEVSLEALTKPDAHEQKSASCLGKTYQYHSYTADGRVIWGATAGILHQILSLLESQ